MNNSLPLNAFMAVRPRGKDLDIPAQPPKSKASKSRETSSFGTLKALDRNGRPTVGLPPRVLGSISIQNREDSRASQDRNDAIKRGTSA